MFKTIFAGALVSTALLSNAVMADDEHFDVDLTVVNNRVVVENNADIDSATGYKIVEAEFHDGDTFTENPGFLALDGVFNPQEPVWYSAVGKLHHFDGSKWVSNFTEELYLYGDDSETIFNSQNVFSGDTHGLIDYADSEGGLHTHLEFEVADSMGDGVVDKGIYMAAIRVYGDDHLSSKPFYIAFNFGLSEAAFEAAIEALAD